MESYLTLLLRARLLVGFLGERAQFGWWPTAFFESSSQLFLAPVFSKTTRLARYHGVVEAARRLHDEHLNVGSFHLFRLPEEIEQDLHGLVQGAANDVSLTEMLQSQAVALDALQRLGAADVQTSVGPTAVGSIETLEQSSALQGIAGAYWSAFSRGTKTYPYLVP